MSVPIKAGMTFKVCDTAYHSVEKEMKLCRLHGETEIFGLAKLIGGK